MDVWFSIGKKYPCGDQGSHHYRVTVQDFSPSLSHLYLVCTRVGVVCQPQTLKLCIADKCQPLVVLLWTSQVL